MANTTKIHRQRGKKPIFTDQELMQAIESKPEATQEEIAQVLKTDRSTVSRRFKQLCQKGILNKYLKNYLDRKIMKYIGILEEQAEKGNAQSIKILAEIQGSYNRAGAASGKGSSEDDQDKVNITITEIRVVEGDIVGDDTNIQTIKSSDES